jgi:hypothetical protein
MFSGDKCATVDRFCLFSRNLRDYDGIILRTLPVHGWRNELSDMSYWIVDGQKLTDEQYEEWELQKRLEKQRIQEEIGPAEPATEPGVCGAEGASGAEQGHGPAD